jgi:replicative DNA helicase
VGTKDGIETVIGVENSSRFERLFDLQVEVAHSYFSNGILSHNSHFLTMIGANALKLKKNVLHYTFELSEEQTAIRYDSNLCEIDSSDIIERKSDVIKKYKESSYGNLIVKYYPTMSVGVPTMRSHIERCSTKNFRPDIIIVDYADVMRSSRQYDSPRHELKMVYEELRGLAGDLGIPVWTASQSNKEGADAEVVDMSNMSEAYAKAMTCDVVITLSRRAQEKALGVGRLFIAKNRAGRDGLVYPISIDTAQSRFTIRGDATLPEDARSEDEQSMKRSILDKWKEIKSQKDLKIEDVNSTKTVEKNKLVTD